MARSASSLRSPRATHTSPRAWNARTPSPPTRTSGSTCPTRAGSRWSANQTGSARRSACRVRRTYRALVERHCDLAAHLAAAVDAAPDLERLAEVPLNVVCFRYRPPGMSEPELDGVNRRLGEALLDDGRVFAGTTVYGGRVALRPAISNWRTTAADLDLLVDVVRELGASAARAG